MIETGNSPHYKVKIDRRVRVSMLDRVELAAVLVRPDAEGRFPAIMSYNPYRWLTQVKGSSSETEYNHRWDGPSYFAERGYAVIYFDVRGTGNSGGSSQDIYSDLERRDAVVHGQGGHVGDVLWRRRPMASRSAEPAAPEDFGRWFFQ